MNWRARSTAFTTQLINQTKRTNRAKITNPMKNNTNNEIQRFFASERSRVDANYHSIEGNFQYADDDYDSDDDGADYESADADFQYADSYDDSWSAAGVQRMPARKSQPYIINVKNTGTADLTDVVFGNPFVQLYESAPAYGNAAGVVITTGIPNVTYKQWLSTNGFIPYVVGMTVVTGLGDSDSEAAAQSQETVSLTESLADGNVSTRPLIFQKDPYQNQNNIVANHTSFKADQFLKFTIATLYAGATMQFKFYPAENVAPTRALGGSSAVRNYAAPNVVNAQRLQIQQSSRPAARRTVRRPQ